MLRLVFLLSLVTFGAVFAAASDMEASEKKADQAAPAAEDTKGDVREEVDPNAHWMSNLKPFGDDEIYQDHPCAGGTPAAKLGCKNDFNCPTGFSCVETRSAKDKVCCLKHEKVLPHMQCPEKMSASANKFCLSDEDCAGEHCHYEWEVPEDLMKELHDMEIKNRNESDPREPAPVGICCTKKHEAPEVMDKCPTGYLNSRHLPCGLSLPGCELESRCMYPKDVFGRCCLSVDVAVKTGLSGYYRRWGYGFRPGFRPYWGGRRFWGARWGGRRHWGPRYYSMPWY